MAGTYGFFQNTPAVVTSFGFPEVSTFLSLQCFMQGVLLPHPVSHAAVAHMRGVAHLGWGPRSRVVVAMAPSEVDQSSPPPPPTPPFPLPAVYSSLIMPLWAVATNAVTRALEFRATNRWACVGCPGGWGLGERGFKHRGVSCFQVRGPSQQPQQPVFLKKKCGPGGPSRGMCGCLDRFSVRLGYGQAVAAPHRHGGTGYLLDPGQLSFKASLTPPPWGGACMGRHPSPSWSAFCSKSSVHKVHRPFKMKEWLFFFGFFFGNLELRI